MAFFRFVREPGQSELTVPNDDFRILFPDITSKVLRSEYNSLATLDLFSGLGGLSRGFSLVSALNSKWALEMDPTANIINFLNKIEHKQIFQGDSSIFFERYSEGGYISGGGIEAMLAGPSCQVLS